MPRAERLQMLALPARWLSRDRTIQSNVNQAGVPLLLIDAWEHAYYLPYRTKKLDYFAALSNLWNWEDVERRILRARELDLGLDDVAFVQIARGKASRVSPI